MLGLGHQFEKRGGVSFMDIKKIDSFLKNLRKESTITKEQ